VTTKLSKQCVLTPFKIQNHLAQGDSEKKAFSPLTTY